MFVDRLCSTMAWSLGLTRVTLFESHQLTAIGRSGISPAMRLVRIVGDSVIIAAMKSSQWPHDGDCFASCHCIQEAAKSSRGNEYFMLPSLCPLIWITVDNQREAGHR